MEQFKTDNLIYFDVEFIAQKYEEITGSEGVRYSLFWEYKHRAMDSKHNPLIIAVTYSFDPIFLKFTMQVYQNQKENQRRTFSWTGFGTYR